MEQTPYRASTPIDRGWRGHPSRRQGIALEERIPQVVIRRLPLYARALADLEGEQVMVISSLELGQQLQITPAQIRKDLSYFGEFGKQGTGYNVAHLLGEIRRILGLDQQWLMALVGVGQLGRAIATYPGFISEGFEVAAAFDNDPAKIGTPLGELVIQDVRELKGTVAKKGITIGIVAVPASAGQEVVDSLVQSDIRAILSYAPTAVKVPEGVHLRQIDPVLALQSMTYYLKRMPPAPRLA